MSVYPTLAHAVGQTSRTSNRLSVCSGECPQRFGTVTFWYRRGRAQSRLISAKLSCGWNRHISEEATVDLDGLRRGSDAHSRCPWRDGPEPGGLRLRVAGQVRLKQARYGTALQMDSSWNRWFEAKAARPWPEVAPARSWVRFPSHWRHGIVSHLDAFKAVLRHIDIKL